MKSFKLLSITLFSVFFSLMSVVQVAEAKRFGGGKSFGYNKQVAPKSYNTQTTTKSATANKSSASTAKSGSAKWLGPLAGMAAGGLLMAMLFGEGFEGLQLFDILVFALIAFLLFKLFVSRASSSRTQASNYAYQTPPNSINTDYAQQRQQHVDNAVPQGSIIGADVGKPLGKGVSDNAEVFEVAPQWFDEQRFLTDAKQHFMTLQQAWDSADLQTIKDYCSEELFAALKAELSGFEPGHSLTIVDTLYAEVAAMAMDGEYFIVSIRFSGFIEEQLGEGAHSFNEVWHIRRLADDRGNWQIAGIQQAGASL